MKIYVLKTHALKIVLFKIAYFTRKVKKLKVVEVRLPRTKEGPVSSRSKYGLTAFIAVTVF